MKVYDIVYTYDYYNHMGLTTKYSIDDALDAYQTYPENLSVMNRLAYCYYFMDDYFNSLTYVMKALNIEKSDQWADEYYYTLKLSGDIYRSLGIHQSSIYYYMEALKYPGHQDLERKRCDVYRHISMIYKEIHSLDLAMDYANESLQLAITLDDEKLIGNAHLSLGRVCFNCEDYDGSLEHSIKAVDRFKNLEYKKGLVLVYHEIAAVYHKQGNHQLVKDFYERALMIANDIRYTAGIIFSDYLLGKWLFNQGDADQALFILEEALNMSRRCNMQRHKVKIYYALSDVYAYKGDFELAYTTYKTGTELKEHVRAESNKERIYKIQNEFNLYVKDEELKKFKEEKKNLEMRNQQLNKEMQLDPLTALLNRRGLKRSIGKFGYNGTHIIVLADIDDFKIINDKYGHPAGDIILKDLSRILRRHSEKSFFVSRWGGEEFLVVLTNTTMDEAVEYTTKIKNLIEDHVSAVDGLELSVTMTFGVAPLVESFETSIQLADQRLYEGKRNGKNRIIYA